jgi:hypothetical protein
LKINRIYHHYSKCEEYKSAMWQTSLGIDQELKIQQCFNFMSDTDVFEANMMLVIAEWPLSCEASLTNRSINQVAWLGQAAAAIGIDCPEDITKKAWALLDTKKQELANSAAKRQIKKWKESHLDKNYA